MLGFRSIRSLAVRIPGACAQACRDAAQACLADGPQNTLIIAPPGVGKTSLLRELIRMSSERGSRVGVIDERDELSGSQGSEGAYDLGPCSDTLIGLDKGTAATMLLRGMNPEIIAMDEITASDDLAAVQNITGCGVILYATAHGRSRDDMRRRALYRDLLEHPEKILAVIKDELAAIGERFGNPRRTQITGVAAEDLDVEDLIAEEDMVVTCTHAGYVKRLPVATYRSQKRGGKGIQGLSLKDNDFVEDLFVASTHDYVMFFTNKGRVYRVKVHELPIGSRHARGSALINVLPLDEGEKPTAVITTREFPSDEYLMFATKRGMVKKTAMSDYDKSRRDGIIAINLKDDDELVNVRRVKASEKVILCSTAGKAILFDESEIRPTGRATSGVRGITLKNDAEMLGMEITNGNGDLLVMTEKGYGKRTPVSEYPEHKRGGQGVATIAMTAKKGNLVVCRVVGPQHELMVVSEEGVMIRVKTADISRLGRSTQGVKIMNIGASDKVSAAARMVAHKKKAAKADPMQAALDLSAAGEVEQNDEESVDIGGDEAFDESMIEDE